MQECWLPAEPRAALEVLAFVYFISQGGPRGPPKHRVRDGPNERHGHTANHHLQCQVAHISKVSKAPSWTSNSAQTMQSQLKSFSKPQSPLPRCSVTSPPACDCPILTAKPWKYEDFLANGNSSMNRYPRQRGFQASQDRHDREHWGWRTTRSYAVQNKSLTTAACYDRNSARDTTQSLQTQAPCSRSCKMN